MPSQAGSQSQTGRSRSRGMLGLLAVLAAIGGVAAHSSGGRSIQDSVHGSIVQDSAAFKVGLRRERVFGHGAAAALQHGQHRRNGMGNSRRQAGSNGAAVEVVEEILRNREGRELELLDLDLILAADSDGDGVITAGSVQTDTRMLVTFTTEINGAMSGSTLIWAMCITCVDADIGFNCAQSHGHSGDADTYSPYIHIELIDLDLIVK